MRISSLPKIVLAAAAVWLAGSHLAPAHEYKLGALEIKHPWSRATPSGAKVGGGYMTLINRGTSPDRLVAISTAGAGKVELHEMTMQDGVMRMRALPQGISIGPGGTVALKPGGFHVMFLDLKAPLKQGESLAATLTFEKAGTVDVTFRIEAMGARDAPAHGHPTH